MPSPSDSLLAEIEALYRSRFSYFVRVARAVVGDRERALEAVQDGFADVIRGRDGYRRHGPLEAWVWRAVLNAARKAATQPLVQPSVAGSSESAEPPLAPADVAPFIAALSERQRLVVFLRYYADLDYRAMASALGIEVGTVSATLSAAHAAVRKALVEVCPDA
jgi:RNA polymerase sigma factor (sigma-70 family)